MGASSWGCVANSKRSGIGNESSHCRTGTLKALIGRLAGVLPDQRSFDATVDTAVPAPTTPDNSRYADLARRLLKVLVNIARAKEKALLDGEP